MKHRWVYGVVAIAIAVVLAVPAQADLTPYSQDFEGLDMGDPGALAADGWLVFGNVFDGTFGFYKYGYGPFPAPNPGGGFSAIVSGQGGPDQGEQQLSVYSDYNNFDHANGHRIESNVFQEQIIGPGDVGQTWIFRFDAKRGNINDPGFGNCPCWSTALAFIKTLDPNAGFQLTNFVTVDTTDLPDAWGSFWLALEIDAGLVGQILQFGFLNNATLYQPSGVYYDNLSFAVFEPDPATQGYWHRQCLGVPESEGGIDPGRNGRGPSGPTEPGFVDQLMPCADARLEELGFYGETTCEGMDAVPAADPCERALKQLTALILNGCPARLLDSTAVDAGAEGCGATTVGELTLEVRDLIQVGECEQAAACAATANEGFGLGDGGGATSTTTVSETEPEPELFRREWRQPRSPRRR